MIQIKRNIAVSDDGFIFDPLSGESYTLNPVGYEIFSMIKNGSKENTIIQKITEKYDVDSISMERYLYDFMASLKLYQLIENNE